VETLQTQLMVVTPKGQVMVTAPKGKEVWQGQPVLVLPEGQVEKEWCLWWEAFWKEGLRRAESLLPFPAWFHF